MKIELWNMDGIGIIIPEKTGIIWTNQVGGVACLHPELEGIYLPVRPFYSTAIDPFLDEFGETKYEPARVATFLSNFHLDNIMMPEPIPDCESDFEAWIWVRIKSKEEQTEDYQGHFPPVHIEQFAGRICVVTYPNSD